ncbi:MAG: CRTAC1 family protein, partial [bacterium]
TALANSGANGRGAAWGDLDGDGDLDVVVANYGSDNLLLRNDGNDAFAPVTGTPFNTDIVNAVCPILFDFDNDGDLDIFVHAIGPSGTARLYRNEGSFVFADATASEAPSFLTDYADGRGAAVADIDGDGDLDVFRANGSATVGGGISYLYLNNTNNKNWLKVKVVGTASDPQAYGARVYVFESGTRNLRGYSQVQSQSGYESFNSLVQHFGLPSEGRYDVEVLFPRSGKIARRGSVSPAQTLTITELNGDGHWIFY